MSSCLLRTKNLKWVNFEKLPTTFILVHLTIIEEKKNIPKLNIKTSTFRLKQKCSQIYRQMAFIQEQIKSFTFSIVKTDSHSVTDNATGCIRACVADDRKSLVVVATVTADGFAWGSVVPVSNVAVNIWFPASLLIWQLKKWKTDY